MSAIADINLLALLEKASNPCTSLPLNLRFKGIYAPPEQWKLTDEANPGLFSYTVEILQMTYAGGKIEPRKLTQKELKEQQEAKIKKGAKKQVKQQEKVVVEDPQAEKKRLQWQALSEEEKFYRTQEDPYKAFSLLWAQTEKSVTLENETLQIFQNSVNNGYFEIILTRKPEGTQDDIAKLKKGKPKNLNLGELYAAKYKGKIKASDLATPGATKIIDRVTLHFSGDLPAECVKIEADKCYALVEIELELPLNPLVTEIKPTPQELLGKSSVATSRGPLLGRLSDEIRKGVRAISQQYASFFSKEKQHSDDKKFNSSSNSASIYNVSTLRINQINKRKQQFLQEFIASGKFGVLRERITKTVKAIIVDKCRKQKQGSKVTKQSLQKILAQLNVFFKNLLEKSLDECISSDTAFLHEDLILNHEYARSTRRHTLAGMSQTEQQREGRLANEYQIINNIDQAEEKYLNLLLNNESTTSLQTYARFCLRHGKHDQAFAIYTRINNSSNEFRHRLLLALFTMQRGRDRQSITILEGLDKKQGLTPDEKVVIHQLLAFVQERLGQEKASEKHIALAQKYYQMKTNPSIRINPPKNPYLQPAPKVPKPGRYISQLSIQQAQQIKLTLMDYFIEYNFYTLASGYINKIGEGERKNHLKALVLMGEKQYSQALEIIQSLLQKNPKNMDYLLLKADICFKSDRMFECEQVFLYILKLKPPAAQAYSIYLRLGLTYLNRKSWQDAKVTFNKAVELRSNSSSGWLGLGIAALQLKSFKESQQAFNLSNIYNPLSQEPSTYLQRISSYVDSKHKQEYKYFQEGES